MFIVHSEVLRVSLDLMTLAQIKTPSLQLVFQPNINICQLKQFRWNCWNDVPEHDIKTGRTTWFICRHMQARWNYSPLKYRWIMELWTVRDCSTYCWDPSDHSMNSLDTESLAEERRCLGAVFSPEHESGAPTDTDGSTRVSHSFSSQPALHHALTHRLWLTLIIRPNI